MGFGQVRLGVLAIPKMELLCLDLAGQFNTAVTSEKVVCTIFKMLENTEMCAYSIFSMITVVCTDRI